MFALVDCNNFYISCERVFNPKLIGKPVVALSNNDGCVIARSNEAKALGIPMGAPAFQYAELFKNHNVFICSSNYSLYADMSHRVMKTLKTFTPELQIYSIDEAFLKLSISDGTDYAHKIRDRVLKWTGIPVSVGIAKTKTLAKVANHVAKKNPEKRGAFALDSKEKIDAILDSLPVTEIWGIGGRLGKRLNKKGIRTAAELRDADDSMIKKNLTVVGLRTAWELREIPCLPLEEAPPPKKSIMCSRTFGRPISSIDELCEAAASYVARAAEKTRNQNSMISCMIIFVVRHPYDPEHSSCSHVKITLPEPTSYTPLLIQYAKAGIKSLFEKGQAYRKVGVLLDGLVPDNNYQLDLFSSNHPKQKKLMKLIDGMNHHFGHNVIRMAAEGTEKPWKMKRLRKSAHFTTSWDHLLVVKI